MKPNHLTASGLRKLSSDQFTANPSINAIISPKTKSGQLTKKPIDSKKKKLNDLADSLDMQVKKHLGSSLKGLLSPVDQKLIEVQKKMNALKFDEESSKNSLKGSARNTEDFYTTFTGGDQQFEMNLKGSKHKKQSSIDNKNDPYHEEALSSKTKTSQPNGPTHTRSQTSTNFYLKDVEYRVNPMFSPVNGPPKTATLKNSHDYGNETKDLKSSLYKRDNLYIEGTDSTKSQENNENLLKTQAQTTKASVKAPLHQFFNIKKSEVSQKSLESRILEGSSEDIHADSKTKKTQGKMLGGHFKPQISISPRYEVPNNLPSSATAKSAKHFYPISHMSVGDLDRMQDQKPKLHIGPIGSLYSKQKEENIGSAKTSQTSKNLTKKESLKEIKRDCFFEKVKNLEAQYKSLHPHQLAINTHKDMEDLQVRPRTTKFSEPNVQKDLHNPIFSAFNSQLKRNSAANIYHSAHLGDHNIQSTRSAVDKTEKTGLSKYLHQEDQKYHQGKMAPHDVNVKIDNVDVELELETDTNIANIVSEITKSSGLNQIITSPNAKFMLLRKQVQDKRTKRGFMSVDQNGLEMPNFYEAKEAVEGEKGYSNFKQGSEPPTGLPDSTHTSTKLIGPSQLGDTYSRVKKVLEMYQKKEKAWENEKKALLAELQLLKTERKLYWKAS